MKSKIFKIRNIGFIICCVGLISIILYSALNPKKANDEDLQLNLDNFSFNNVALEEKLKVTNSYNAFVTSWSSSGENSGFSGNKFEKEDKDRTRFSSQKVKGIKTINATLAEDCTVQWKIKSISSKGKAVILVVVDKELILKEYDANVDTEFTYKSEGKHEILVKILCEDAAIEIEVERLIL